MSPALRNPASVSLVIPAYEEEGAIRAGKLLRVTEWSLGFSPPAEVLVVDDGSADATAQLAEASGARVLRIPHGGKAAAVRAGIFAALGDYVLFSDMDQAVPVREAARLVAALDAGADLALGTRGLGRPGAPLPRRLMSLGHWVLRKLLLGLPWRDTQCGFKGFRREAVLEILARLKVYGAERAPTLDEPRVDSGFDVECLLVARRLGMEIREVPVSWSYQDTRRVLTAGDSWRGLKDLLAIAAALKRGYYPEAPPGPGQRP